MKRFLLFACLVPLLACAQPTKPIKETKIKEAAGNAKTALARYTLEVTFDGLIAFVQQKRQGKNAVWALLVAADYNPLSPKADEIPFCADPHAPTFPQDFPPHLAALRFKDAAVELNGIPIGGIVPLVLLEGL